MTTERALAPIRPPRAYELAFYAVCRAIAVGLSYVIFPGPVVGRERLPATGSYVLAPLHRSNIDWVIAARVTRRRLRFVAKAEVWKLRPLGALVSALGCFPVRRGGADREALGRCLEVLALGEPLVVFPEGTRGSGPTVPSILEGAAYLALRAGVPLVPVGVSGSEKAMPRGRRLPRPSRVAVVVGEPLHTSVADGERPSSTHVSRRASAELTEQLRTAIEGYRPKQRR